MAAEDTRRTRALLEAHGVHAPLISYFEHNQARRGPELLRRLQGGARVALVTDAGTPGVSDPGFRLVRLCRDAGVPVVPIPGPSALVAALSAAGVPADRFVFEVVLAREVTKRFEEFRRGTAASLRAALAATGVRGEVTLVINPREAAAPDAADE